MAAAAPATASPEFATKADIADLKAGIVAEIAALKVDHADLKTDIASLKTDIADRETRLVWRLFAGIGAAVAILIATIAAATTVASVFVG